MIDGLSARRGSDTVLITAYSRTIGRSARGLYFVDVESGDITEVLEGDVREPAWHPTDDIAAVLEIGSFSRRGDLRLIELPDPSP